MALEPGSVVQDRYTIIRSLKSGGMGAVYEAQDGRLGGTCAIKEMLDAVVQGDDAELVRRKFQEEAQILCKLRHPGIPGVRDFFYQGPTCYIVMDLVHGANLEQELQDYLRLTGEPFPVETLLDVAHQVLRILEYLHFLQPPVIHRDIKPANIIREFKTGRVKLVDFGLARSVTDMSQTMVGTLGYCPLEQMQGHSEPRSDLYALGVTMHHLLSGQAPAPLSLPPLGQVAPWVPEGVAQAVDRATQRDVGDRFSDAVAMRQALQGWVQGPPTTPISTSTATVAAAAPVPLAVAPPAPGSKLLWPAVAGFGVLGLLGLGIALRGQPEPTRVAASTRTPVSAPVAVSTPSPASTPAASPVALKTTPSPRPTPPPRVAPPPPAPVARPSPATLAASTPPPKPAYPLARPRINHQVPEPPAVPPPAQGPPPGAPPPERPGAQGVWLGTDLTFSAPGFQRVQEDAHRLLLQGPPRAKIRGVELRVTESPGTIRDFITREAAQLQEEGWRVLRGAEGPRERLALASLRLERQDYQGLCYLVLDPDPPRGYSVRVVASSGEEPNYANFLGTCLRLRGQPVPWL